MIDARAAMTQILALARAGRMPEPDECRRLALRATSAIGARATAARLQDRLVTDMDDVRLTLALGKGPGDPSFDGSIVHALEITLKKIEAASWHD